MYTMNRYCMLINAQSASLCSMLAAESTAAETNAASSFDRSPAMDQIYQIPIFLNFIHTVDFDWAQSPECVLIFEKNVKKLTCSALSTWVSKRNWVGQSKPLYPPPALPSPSLSFPLQAPLPIPSPLWKMQTFQPEISEISAQAKISERKLLRKPRSLERVPQFFCLIFCLIFLPLPSPSNKAGWPSQ